MLVGGVCSAALNSKSIEDRNIKCCDKVAVRSSADRLLPELKTETSSYLPRLPVKFHYSLGPLQRTTIETTRDTQLYTLVKRLELTHQFTDPLGFFHGAETHIQFNLCLGCNYIGARASVHKADIKARAAGGIAHRVKPLRLACEFQNCASSSLRIQAGVRSNPLCLHFPHAHPFARRFHLAPGRRRLKHQHLRRAPRFFF